MNQLDKDIYNDEIDLAEVFSLLWSKKRLIASITSIAAILSVLYSLSLPNIYESKALLAPAASEDSLKSKLGNLASLTSIAGVSLPPEFTNSKEAIARMKSLQFFSNNILPRIKLEDLMAVEEWIPEQNTLIYNENLFDSDKNKWVRNVSYPRKTIPSEQEAFKVFKRMVSITEDTKTLFISISVEHKSATIAYEWLNIIIDQINETMRKIDAQKAENAITYLTEKSKSTNIQSSKDAISNLLENQIQTLMLTSSDDREYVLKVIDAPVVAELKSKPSRAMICIIGTLLGGILSLVVVFLQNFRQSKINN